MSSKLESDVCCHLQVGHLVKATEVTAGLAESNGSWDQLQAQLSVTSMGKLYLFLLFVYVLQMFEGVILCKFS